MNYERCMRSYRLFRLTNDTWEALQLAFMLERLEEERASVLPVVQRLPLYSLMPLNDLYDPDDWSVCDGSSA
jgi:hypothetical protein